MQRDDERLGLPAVLVEDILRRSEDAGASLVDSIRSVQDSAGPIRKWLREQGMLLAGPGGGEDAAATCGM